MKTFKEYLYEMALDLGDASEFPFEKKGTRKGIYAFSQSNGFHSNPTPINDIEVKERTHINYTTKEPITKYYTNDNKKKETVHASTVITHNPTKQLPFKHDEQTDVIRQKSDSLPHGYATNFIYNHFKNSEHPLRSSSEQFNDGNKMWNKLAHKALDDGHHVYYHDGEALNKSNKENIDSHLKSYFGDSPEHINKHIILSKTELKGTK